MSSIYDVDNKKAAVGMGAMRAPGSAPGNTSGVAATKGGTPGGTTSNTAKNTTAPTAPSPQKPPAAPNPAAYSGASSGGTAQTNQTTASHRVPVPEHLQGGKVGTTWGYEDVARDREEQGAFEQTSTGGGTVYQNTGAGSGSGGNPLAWWNQWNQTRPADIWGQHDQQGSDGNVLNATNQGYVDAMKEAYDAQAQARAAALEQMLRMYDGQNALIGQQYDQAARDAYANARISAIGNNEALAAQGLAGGLYQSPTSGMSETSRVAQDNALRSNLLSVQIARQQAAQQVAQDINALRAQGMYDAADLAASQAEALINLQMQLNEQQYQREIDAFNMQNA